KRTPSRSSLTSTFDASAAPSPRACIEPCWRTGAAVARLAVDAASECVRGPQAKASAPAHSNAMATRDGESDGRDMNPRTGTALSGVGRSRRDLAEAIRSRFEAGRNLTKSGTNG